MCMCVLFTDNYYADYFTSEKNDQHNNMFGEI